MGSDLSWTLCACELWSGAGQNQWAEQGVLVATGHSDGSLAVWSVTNCKMLCRIPNNDHGGKLYCIASMQSSGRLITGSSAKLVKIWKLGGDWDTTDVTEDGCITATTAGEVWACCAVHISDGSDVIVSCHSTGTVRLWNSNTRAQLGEIEIHFPDPVSAYCAPQADRLVVNSSVGVRVFRLTVKDPEATARLAALKKDPNKNAEQIKKAASISKLVHQRRVGRGRSAIALHHSDDAHFEISLARRFGNFSSSCVVVSKDVIISTESTEAPGTLSFWSFSRGVCTR